MPRNKPYRFADHEVARGRRIRVEIPISRLPTGNWVTLPIEVLNGRRTGPVLWLSGAIHGDELNGIAIIRHILRDVTPSQLGGVLIAVPIVNVFGVMQGSRYLPDRRDLNRSFPGTARGSMASRLAHLFMQQVVQRCDYGLDLHTGAGGRDNLPQVRGNLDDPTTHDLARAFGAPAIMHARDRPGSLRAAGAELGKPVLLYEGGEALRFGPDAIRRGVNGVLRVMRRLGMWEADVPAPEVEPVLVRKASWVRAGRSGLVETEVDLGQRVTQGQILAVTADTFGSRKVEARSPFDGMVISLVRNPVVSRGEALVNVAQVEGDSP